LFAHYICSLRPAAAGCQIFKPRINSTPAGAKRSMYRCIHMHLAGANSSILLTPAGVELILGLNI
jgi:hypothetical protein